MKADDSKEPREKDLVESLAGVFLNRDQSQRRKMLWHAALIWVFSVVLCTLVMDGGGTAGRYGATSMAMWPLMLIYAYRNQTFTTTESAVFRALPFFLFIFFFFYGSVLD